MVECIAGEKYLMERNSDSSVQKIIALRGGLSATTSSRSAMQGTGSRTRKGVLLGGAKRTRKGTWSGATIDIIDVKDEDREKGE